MGQDFFSPSIRKLVGKSKPAVSRRHIFLRWVSKVLILLCLFVFLWFGFLVFLSHSYVLEVMIGLMPSQSLSGTNILVYGVDDTRRVQRSDTIILVHLSEVKDRIVALSIPRDTRVVVPGVGETKINHSFAHGGDALLKLTVSQFLDVPVHHSVKVNLSGVEKLIDSVGGVTIDVPKRLKYTDLAGNFSMDIPKGRRHLNGVEAVHFLRFRHDRQGDIGRIERQQLFLKELIDQTLQAGTFFRLPSIIWSFRQLIKSDLSMLEMVDLAKKFSKVMYTGRIEKMLLPGRVGSVRGVSYWLVEPEVVSKMMVEDFFQFQVASSFDGRTPVVSEPEELFPDFQEDPSLIISQQDLMVFDEDEAMEFADVSRSDMRNAGATINTFSTASRTEVLEFETLLPDEEPEMPVIQPLKKSMILTFEMFQKESVEEVCLDEEEPEIPVVHPLKKSMVLAFEMFQKESVEALHEDGADSKENVSDVVGVTFSSSPVVPLTVVKREIVSSDVVSVNVVSVDVVSSTPVTLNPIQDVLPLEKAVDLVDEKTSVEEVTESIVVEDNVLVSSDRSEENTFDLSSYGLEIEILNGYGKAGEALRAAEKVQALGLTIFKTDNSGRFDYKETKLVDWKGNRDVANRLAKRLFIDSKNIVVYNNPAKPIDFTLVLGADWEEIRERL